MIISDHLNIKWIFRGENGKILHIASGSVKGLENLATQSGLKPFLVAYPETVEIETLLLLETRLLEDSHGSVQCTNKGGE